MKQREKTTSEENQRSAAFQDCDDAERRVAVGGERFVKSFLGRQRASAARHAGGAASASGRAAV